MPHDRFKIDVERSALAPVSQIVTVAQREFNSMLRRYAASGGLRKETYVRYLSFQHHLTANVQRAFLAVAAHLSLANRRELREFLFNFALEEEPHSAIAERDLSQLGYRPLDCPLDVKLWWSYFDEVIQRTPFVRLGATCVLENLGAGGGQTAKNLLAGAPFINAENSKFIQIHFHEALPHGDQIYWALSSVSLAAAEIDDLVRGAREGAVMYLRMAAWALRSDPVQELFDSECTQQESAAQARLPNGRVP